MFDNIAELEKEVQEFEKNILASSQLVKSIEQLAKATEMQVRSFAKDSEALLSKIEQQNADEKEVLHSDVNLLLSDSSKKTQEEVRRVIDSAVEKIQKTQNEYVSAIQKTELALKNHEESVTQTIRKDAERCLADYSKMLQSTTDILTTARQQLTDTQQELANARQELTNAQQQLTNSQQQCISQIGEINSSLAKREETLCTKMDTILERLEKFDLEDFRVKYDGISKSINTRFTIAMVGIVGTLAFVVLSFFMK